MFAPEKPLPPPPTAAKPRNESMGSTLPTYRSRPRGTGSFSAGSGTPSSGGGGSQPQNSGFSFSNAKNMFESLNKPEVRNGIANIAKNPAVQKAAVSAAKNEQVRNAAYSAAKNENVQNAAISAAQDQNTRNAAISAAQNPTTRNHILDLAKQFESRPIMKMQTSPTTPSAHTTSGTNFISTSSINQSWGGSGYSSTSTTTYGNSSFSPPPPAPKPSDSTNLYPNLSSIDPFDHPPVLPSKHQAYSQQHTSPQPIDPYPLKPPPVTSKPSSFGGYRPKSVDPEPASSWNTNRTSWNSKVNAFDMLGGDASYGKKKPAPARPPPPKLGSRSMTNLAGLSSLSPSPDPNLKEPHAIVKYPYKKAHPDELNCEPNDTVLLKREVDDQWIFAMNTRTGESGIVPLSFLQVKVPLVPIEKAFGGLTFSVSDYTGFNSQGSKNMARALYDYETGVDGDLRFKAGELINIIERINDEWLRGEIHGKKGIFPITYVQIDDLYSIPMEQKSFTTSTSTLGATFDVPKVTMTALYDYDSGMADDLKFKAGDAIEVVKYVNDEWIMGRSYGQEGLVPLTFVQQN